MKQRKILNLFARYIIVLSVALGNLFLFYKIFTKPTIYLSYLFLSFFKETIILENLIIFGGSLLNIANACIAGSAYYFLFILSMSIPLNFSRRVKLILFSFFTFFIVNVLRIVLMAFLIESLYFQQIHFFLWHFFSTIFVVLIWLSAVKILKIKEIPFYTDYLSIKNSKNSKTRNKN